MNGRSFNDLVAKIWKAGGADEVACSESLPRQMTLKTATKSPPAATITKQHAAKKPKLVSKKVEPSKSVKHQQECQVGEDMQRRDAHVQSIWAVTLPSTSSRAPVSSQASLVTSQKQVTHPAKVSSSIPCTGTSSSSLKPMPDFFQPKTQAAPSDMEQAIPVLIQSSPRPTKQAASSDIDMSSESEEELVSSPRSVVRNCTSCAKHRILINDLQQEVAALKRQVAESSDQSHANRPKAGIVSPEVATEFGMLETYKQSGVYWYKGQKDAVLFKSKEPEQLLNKMMDVFFFKGNSESIKR